VTVFSPFGLGVLDLAVGQLVRERALETGRGTLIESFLPVNA
jgi:ornithine cyclodeaminase